MHVVPRIQGLTLKPPDIKQLQNEVEYDIENYHGRGLCYPSKPMAEVDNTNRGIDNSRYYRKTEFNNCFIVYIHLLYIHLTLRTGSKPFCLRFQKF